MHKHYIFFSKNTINKNRLHSFLVSIIDDTYYFIEFYTKKEIIQIPYVINDSQFNYLLSKYEHKEIIKKDVKFKKSRLSWVNCIGLTKMYLGIDNKRIINEYDLYNYIFYNKVPNLFKTFYTILKELLWVVV